MTSNQKIRFAVIGCGHIGKRHASIIQAHSDCSLVALCDGKAKEDLDLTAYADALFFNSIDNLLAANLNLDVVVKTGIFIIPLGNDIYKVGATYNWEDKTNTPTAAARKFKRDESRQEL